MQAFSAGCLLYPRRKERLLAYRGSVAKKPLLFSTEAEEICISGYEVSKADGPEPAELFDPRMLNVSSPGSSCLDG